MLFRGLQLLKNIKYLNLVKFVERETIFSLDFFESNVPGKKGMNFTLQCLWDEKLKKFNFGTLCSLYYSFTFTHFC
jgi:hypothetical protein